MITFSKLGVKGNLGNQLFQIASTIGIAEKYKHDFFFPEWGYSKYFKHKLPVSYKDESFKSIKEKEYNYHEWDLKNGNYDLNGWLQSEKYFNISKTKLFFQFEDFSKNLYEKYNSIFSKKTILISVRRGDFIKNQIYLQLSYLFYFKALIENFPDWEERNIVFTSDDIGYCKYHFSFLRNSFFLENLTPVEQLVLGSKCNDFIISNSTFSWWLAWLGEKEKSKIIRPISNFQGKFANQNNDSDYFPERWIKFDDRNFPIHKRYFVLYIKGSAFELFLSTKFLLYKIKQKFVRNIKRLFYK